MSQDTVTQSVQIVAEYADNLLNLAEQADIQLQVSAVGMVFVVSVKLSSALICPLALILAANIKEALEEVAKVSCAHLRIVDFVRADELNTMMED